MTTTWGASLLAALLVTVLATPLVRRAALRWRFVDHPADRKGHVRTMPYGGGVAIAIGCAVGTAVGPFTASARTVALLGAAALLAIVGLVDDRRTLGPGIRFGAEIVVAVLAYAAGIRAVATGIEPLDFVVTVVWIAGLTNAFNLMDNMDGLSTAVAVAVAVPLFAIAALGGQYRVATISIALAGACVGFIAHNFRPATIFMGDCGALFIGFLLATLSLQVDPALAPPASFLVPLVLLAVLIVDTTTVTVGRLRHDRSPLVGGKDHLSHRLVARGLSREQAILLLAAFQLVLGVLALLAGRKVLPLGPTMAAAAVLVAVLVAVAVPGKMYGNHATGISRRLRVTAGLVFVGVFAAAVPAAVALLQARGPMRLGADQANAALAAARAGDTARAASLFADARARFAAAQRHLDGPLASLGLAVPVVSSNLRAGRTLANTGRDLTDAGNTLATKADPSQLRLQGGKVDLAALAALGDELRTAERTLRVSLDAVRSVDYPYLVPPVASSVDRLRAELDKTWKETRDASAAARLLPLVLGRDGERRYFLAVQNNAEARATGGFIGNYGELVAAGGELRLARFGRIGELNGPPGAPPRDLAAPTDYAERYGRFDVPSTWQNVNLSPDLATVTKVIADLYPKSGGSSIDGVITVDPAGLAALLQVTGPVSVAPWPEPIGAANVVDVTLKSAYERFPDQEERVRFLGDVAEQVVTAATSADLGSPPALVRTLGPAVRGGHLQVSLLAAREQRVLRTLGIDRSLRAAQRSGDSVLLTTQNAAANKLDVYLRRRLRYEIRIVPGSGDAGDSASVTGTLRAELHNTAPDSGLPASVIGPYDDRFVAGENRSFVSLYTPFALQAARVDSRATGLEAGVELGRSVYSTYLSIPAGGTRTLELDLAGTLPLDGGGWYDIDVLQQPTLVGDDVEVSVAVPEGWRISAVDGLSRVAPTRASARFTLDEPRRLRVQLERKVATSVLDRLLAPPPAR